MNGPYSPVGAARPFTLTPDKLKAAPQIVGTPSPAAYFDVPQAELLIPRPGAQLRFYVKAYQDFPAAGAGETVLTVTESLMVQSPRRAPAFPTKAHPDVLAFAKVGGAWRPVTVNAVNWQTGAVTVTAPVGNAGLRVAYLPGRGEFELRAERPNGGDLVSAKLYGNSLRAIHETDQDSLRSAPRFGTAGQTPFALAPQFRLSLVVRSDARIFWDSAAQNEFSISADVLPIAVHDAAKLAALAELQNRGGYV